MSKKEAGIPGIRVLGVVAALVLVAAACSGDDAASTTSAANENSTATTATTATTAITDQEAGESAADDQDPGGIIRQLQTDLTDLGYYDGSIDGIYGSDTEAAVEEFQAFAGIEVDGQYGAQTAEAIDTALGRPGAGTGVQSALAALCYYYGPIDGDYGPLTEASVRAFQRDAGLVEDGGYGPTTAAALVAAWPSRPDECPEVPDDPETVNAITVISGDTGLTFNDEISCVLGPDDSGLIEGRNASGTTIAVTLDGTASRVVIEGPEVSIDAPFTSVSNDAFALTVEASPPPITVLVVLSFCNEE